MQIVVGRLALCVIDLQLPLLLAKTPLLSLLAPFGHVELLLNLNL